MGAPHAVSLDAWGWFFEWTPAFFGAGILTGVNASVSLWAGCVLAWGIIGPALMASGTTVARDFSADYQGLPYFNYTKMSFTDPKGLVSPRFYLLWSGIFIMLVVSLYLLLYRMIDCSTDSLACTNRDLSLKFSVMVDLLLPVYEMLHTLD